MDKYLYCERRPNNSFRPTKRPVEFSKMSLYIKSELAIRESVKSFIKAVNLLVKRGTL
jgi:hypothetical protein